MFVGESPGAHFSESLQIVAGDVRQVDGALRVPQLPDIIVLGRPVHIGDSDPACKDVAGCLRRAQTFDDPSAVVRKFTLLRIGFENGFGSLLDLKDQRISRIRAFKNDNPRSRSDRTHTDDLSRHVDNRILVDQRSAFSGQAHPVLFQNEPKILQGFFTLVACQLPHRHDKRGIADNLLLPVHCFGEFGGRGGAVLVHRLADRLSDLPARLRFEFDRIRFQQIFDIDMGIPDFKVSQFRKSLHAFPIILRGIPDNLPALLFGEAAVSSADFDAGQEAFDIPFPWSRKRFVKVVQIEDQSSFRAAENSEVRDMRITAVLHPDAGGRRFRQIVRHDDRGTPIERKRRDGHPLVADRQELLNTVAFLLLQQIDTSAASLFHSPFRLGFPRNLFTKRLSGSQARGLVDLFLPLKLAVDSLAELFKFLFYCFRIDPYFTCDSRSGGVRFRLLHINASSNICVRLFS